MYAPPVEEQPKAHLRDWAIYRVTDKTGDKSGDYATGYFHDNYRRTTKIQSLAPDGGFFTKSGREYSLIGDHQRDEHMILFNQSLIYSTFPDKERFAIENVSSEYEKAPVA